MCPRKTMLVLACSFAVALRSTPGQSQEPLLTGRAFELQLRSPVSVYWSAVPLRESLRELAAAQHIAIWLDRRCDPSQPIRFRVNGVSLADGLLKFSADQERLDAAWINGTVIVGPPGVPDRVATVDQIHRQLLHRLPPIHRDCWQHKNEMDWPELTTPQQLLTEIEREVGRPILGVQQVPHDLWPAMRLPSLPAYARLALVLAGFDLTFVFEDNGAAKIVKLPERPRYSAPIPRDQVSRVRQLVASDPSAHIDETGRFPKLLASWRLHQLIGQSRDPLAAAGKARELRYSLRVDHQPIGELTKGLCRQLELEVQFSPAAMSQLEQQVSFEVQDATMEQLVRTAMEAARLQYRLDGYTLRVIGPAP